MKCSAKVDFFDGIAEKWDGWEDLPALAGKLDRGLDEFGIGREEIVLDVGCGTGNLTLALLRRLSPGGRVVAVDFSPAMLAAARSKAGDPRVEWLVADAQRLPLSGDSIDRAICYSVWPHFDDPRSVTAELFRVLRPGGRLHVWHLLSRRAVNDIHASAGEAVRGDVLRPAAETTRVLEWAGLVPDAVVDDEQRYLISAVKPG